MVTRGALTSISETRSTPSSKCSRLSRISSMWRSRRNASRCALGSGCSVNARPSASPSAETIWFGLPTEASATNTTPSANTARWAVAVSSASRVLPIPPGPIKVRRRQDGLANILTIALSSSSRPTNEVGCNGNVLAGCVPLRLRWLVSACAGARIGIAVSAGRSTAPNARSEAFCASDRPFIPVISSRS